MRRGIRRKHAHSSRGLTLLELVIAIFILSVGTLAALRGVDQSRRGIGQDSTRLMAQIVARNRAEELRLLGAALGQGLPAQVPMGPYMFTISQTIRRTSGGLIRADIVARATDGPGALVVTFLPAPGAGG